MDYQVLGMLNFKFTQQFGLGLGWRYLDVDYRPSNHQFVYDVTMSGALVGIDLQLRRQAAGSADRFVLGFADGSFPG